MSTPIPVKLQPMPKRIRNFDEVDLGYSRRSAVEEARRCPQCNKPLCRQVCPLGIDIPLFIRHMREGDFSAALNKIRETNPFPEICGRLCPAPCEARCILQKENAAIEIRALERAAYDHGHKRFIFRSHPASTGAAVAIIGSGPCGLAAAKRLAENNYRVTVFESLPQAGGILRTVVPEFRIPAAVLKQIIQDLKRTGVRFENDITVGKTLACEALFQMDFRAILFAGGAGSIVIPDMPGIDAKRVYAAEELLWQANLLHQVLFKQAMQKKLGEHPIVVGNTPRALDAARICARLGKTVDVVFDDIEDNLKAHPHERQQILEEGVTLRDLTLPVGVVADDQGGAIGIRCLSLDYGDPDGEGDWRLLPVPGSEHILQGDSVIFAQADFSQAYLPKIFPGIQVDIEGMIRVNPETGMTDIAGVFAAGGGVDKDLSLVEIIESGLKAASHIQKYIS